MVHVSMNLLIIGLVPGIVGACRCFEVKVKVKVKVKKSRIRMGMNETKKIPNS